MTDKTFGKSSASRRKAGRRVAPTNLLLESASRNIAQLSTASSPISSGSGVTIGAPSAIIDSSVPAEDAPKLLRQTEEFRERGQTQSTSGTGFGARPHPLLGQSVEDVDRLLETFQNRRKFILGRKRAPGRAALLLVNR